ncbi:MAG TPA: chorismate mutase, partial [Bacteroidota bacterium]|nr:chorismate mutase [Bacteroidota bacterium]
SMIALVIADHLMRQNLLTNETNVKRIRQEIDLLDEMFLILLSRRQELVREVGRWKKQNKVVVLDPKREEQIIRKQLALAGEADLDPEFIKIIFEAIFEHSRAVQKTV